MAEFEYVEMSKQTGEIIKRNVHVGGQAYTRLTEPVVSLLASRQVTLGTNFDLIHLKKHNWIMYKTLEFYSKHNHNQAHAYLMLADFNDDFCRCCEFVIA